MNVTWRSNDSWRGEQWLTIERSTILVRVSDLATFKPTFTCTATNEHGRAQAKIAFGRSVDRVSPAQPVPMVNINFEETEHGLWLSCVIDGEYESARWAHAPRNSSIDHARLMQPAEERLFLVWNDIYDDYYCMVNTSSGAIAHILFQAIIEEPGKEWF